MAAVAYPTTSEWQSSRPHLRVVPPRRPHRSRVLRRRRRVAALVVLVVAVLAVVGSIALVRAVVGAFGGEPLTSPEPPIARSQPVVATSYVVRPGDTLWSIARAAHPSGDVRPYVDRLAKTLHGQPLQPGQRIEPP